MGRPKKANPKNKHIGIVTTEDKFQRFKALNLVGDAAIDVLLYYLEKDNKKLQIDKAMTVTRIKNIDKQIKDLEYEKLQLETELEELNKQIGLNGDAAIDVDVEKAVNVILQRYNNQSVYNIMEFLNYNEELLKSQAYLCGIDEDKLYMLVFENSEAKL